MTRFEFDPKWVFFEFEPCSYIERCGKEALYPYKHPTAPPHKKLFAKGLCTSCYFHLSKLSGKRTCAYPGCGRFILPARNNRGVVPSRFLHNGRGLCNTCWMRAHSNGTIHQYEGGGWHGNVHTETRDKEILRLLTLGWSRQRVASKLGISSSTVKRVTHGIGNPAQLEFPAA